MPIAAGEKRQSSSLISEGFWADPVAVEAGSQGIPLLLSDIPVFHEIAGERATSISQLVNLRHWLLQCASSFEVKCQSVRKRSRQ